MTWRGIIFRGGNCLSGPETWQADTKGARMQLYNANLSGTLLAVNERIYGVNPSDVVSIQSLITLLQSLSNTDERVASPLTTPPLFFLCVS